MQMAILTLEEECAVNSLIVVGARAAQPALRRCRQVPPDARFDLRVWNIGPLSLLITDKQTIYVANKETLRETTQSLTPHVGAARLDY